MPGALGVGDDLGARDVGEQRRQHRLVLGGDQGQVDDDGGRAVRQGQELGVGLARAQAAGDHDPQHPGLPVRSPQVPGEPGPHRPGLEVGTQDGRGQGGQAPRQAVPRGGARVVGGVGEGQDPSGPLGQGTQLQGLHDTGQGGPVGAREPEVPAHVQAQVDVGQETVEAAVAHDVPQVVAQGLAGLAPDLVGVGDDAVEAVVEAEPLGGGLGAHPGHPGEVVAGLAHQGRQVGVALRRHPVAPLDLGGGHAAQGGHAPDGVEHGAPLGDGLEGVTVPRADEDLHARLLGAGGQGGQDVVGLDVLLGQGAHAHGGQEVLDEGDLADEGLGGRVAVGLVEGVVLGAEGASGQVEGHGHVRGALAVDQGQEHGGEAVDGVGGLAGGGGEVLDRQGVEGAEGHGVAVDEEEPRGVGAGG